MSTVAAIKNKQVDSNSEISINDKLKNKLKQHYQSNLFRSRLTGIKKQEVNNKGKLNFASNDYLGFACNDEITTKTSELVKTLGVGSGGSNLITGYHTIHQDLENEISDYYKTEQTILFSSGFLANLALADVLLNIDNKNTIALHDHNNHASILDGSRLAAAKIARYKHNDLEHLQVLINKYQNIQNKILFTESLFSMDGDFADLHAINKILNPEQNTFANSNNCLVIDDSHNFGLNNTINNLTQKGNNTLVIGTFGKAMGASGAFVTGPKIFIESLIQFARPYIYTTALSPVISVAALQAVRLNKQTSEFRDKLFENIDYFTQKIKVIGIEPANNYSPIQPIIVGNAENTIKAAEFLQKRNIIITAIRAPSVANNKSRLRITLSAEHTKQDIDYLVKQLDVVKQEYLTDY